MKNFDDTNNAPNEDEDAQESYVTLTDDDGNEVSFELLGIVEHKERSFAVLLPFDEEDDGIVILELVPSEDPEYDDFVSVDDDTLLEEVYEVFKSEYEGDYDFE